MKRRLLSLLALCFASWIDPASAAGPMLDSRPAMRATVERLVRETGAPGAAWVAVRNGTVLYADSTGLASRASGQALAIDTPMLVGSVSKPVTAVAVMQLVEQGKVQLDTPVRTYLPWFRLADEAAAARITIRQILSHTSGLSTADGRGSSLSNLGMEPDALEQDVRRLASVRTVATPGTHWEYSNLNYQIAGAVIEAVSGERYERYVENHVLWPLGMRDSYVVDPPRPDRTAAGHRFWFLQAYPDAGPMAGRRSGPQGFVVMSARDLGRFLAALSNGRDDILLSRTKAAMMRPQPASPRYGLGWSLRIMREPRLAFHSGLAPGFEAIAAIDIDTRQAYAVLTNTGDGLIGRIDALTWGSADAALGINGSMPQRWQAYALVIALAAITLAALVYAWRLIRRRVDRNPLENRTASPFRRYGTAAALALLAGLLPFTPRFYDMTLASAWLFAPDATILLAVACAALLLASVSRFVAPN